MPFAEVIFEPGSKSVLVYDDEEELKSFLKEHHRRAVSGEPGGSSDWSHRTDIEPELANQADRNAQRPAERVTKVFLYDKHPADWNPGGLVHKDSIANLSAGMATDAGWINGNQLIEAIRDEVSPVYPVDQGKHESIYKLEGKPFDLSFLDEGGSNE